ncbi:MAG TPA: response regulator transcription factor [Anaerolineales bacterium]|nr:response regulator transcription factor [Anaerolineales bacterium]
MKALIVDDDLALADVLAFTMRRAGYEVLLAHDGLAALERWREGAPDLVILDLNLPKLDGLKVCRQIRSESDTPVIILSVRGEEDDVVKGLELGADDYVVKPFSPRQLIARAEAVLRRAKTSPLSPAPLTAGGLTLDPARGEVLRGRELVAQLTRQECRLLEVLMMNKGQVLTADSLIDGVWGSSGGDRAMLKQLVYRLRRKVEADPSSPAFVKSVAGVGYVFEAEA